MSFIPQRTLDKGIALIAKRDNASITGEDVPATLREKYDLDAKLTLAQIRELQTTTEAELKALK